MRAGVVRVRQSRLSETTGKGVEPDRQLRDVAGGQGTEGVAAEGGGADNCEGYEGCRRPREELESLCFNFLPQRTQRLAEGARRKHISSLRTSASLYVLCGKIGA